jgi:hypothetical protein
MWKKVIFCWVVFMSISAVTHYVRGYFKTPKPYKKIVVIHQSNFAGTIEAKSVDKKGYTLHITNKETGKKDTLFLHYDIYALQAGDINNDGSIDICVGVVAASKQAQEKQKNLFFLEINNGQVRPLLAQSILSKDIESFKVIEKEGKNIIRTIEKEKKLIEKTGIYHVREYTWQDRQLKLLGYKGKYVNLAKAKFLMYQQ